jgi:hypothetical protein
VLPDQQPVAGLPEGVSLAQGLLTVSFENGPQLIEKLFLLARVLATQPHLLDR